MIMDNLFMETFLQESCNHMIGEREKEEDLLLELTKKSLSSL